MGRFLKMYTVFNIAQVDGLEPPAWPRLGPLAFQPIARCEQLVAAIPTPPFIRHGASAAYMQGWLRRLRQDKTLLVAAAAQAQRAANWLTQQSEGRQSAPQEQEESL